MISARGPAEQQVGERHRRLGLADAARAAQQEHAGRLVRVAQVRLEGLDASHDRVERGGLADDPLGEALLEVARARGGVAEDRADRHAGPARHHVCDGAAIDRDRHHRIVLLDLGKLEMRGPLQLDLRGIAGLVRQAPVERADAIERIALLLPAVGDRVARVLSRPGARAAIGRAVPHVRSSATRRRRAARSRPRDSRNGDRRPPGSAARTTGRSRRGRRRCRAR